MTEQPDVIKAWDESGRYWEKYGQTIRAMFEPISVALMEAARIGDQDSVLDVAAGVGEPSLTIAARRPGAAIFSTDPTASMIRGAKKEAARLRLPNVCFAQCVDEALPFGERSFDAVVCRFGVMFFRDPLLGVRELLRVVKAGRRVATAVWGASEDNPFHHSVADLISIYVPSPPAGPDDLGAFRFAQPGKLAAVFQQAGAAAVSDDVLNFTIEVDKTPEEFWYLRSEMSENARDKIKKLPDDRKARLFEDAMKVLPRFYSSGRMRFPARILIVTGTAHR